MSDVLSARNLRKRFVDGDRELGVLNGIDVDVKAGERIAVVGRSGSGKSTLLHILAGLTEPDVGEVSVVGQSMTSASSDGRAAIRNHHMGFVYQFHHLLPEFSALENVAMPLIISGRSSLESEERAMNLLSAVDLAERLGHRHINCRAANGSVLRWPGRWQLSPTSSWPTNPREILIEKAPPRC